MSLAQSFFLKMMQGGGGGKEGEGMPMEEDEKDIKNDITAEVIFER
jgi:hypothetical protein